MPYWPEVQTPIDRRPSEPSAQSCTWSMAALAALAALDAPRASMISAPRLPTRGMNSFSYQSMSHLVGGALTVHLGVEQVGEHRR